jgi:hypothetical protein
MRLKCYSVAEGYPSELLHSELIQINGSEKSEFLSFAQNIGNYIVGQDSIFVSIENLNDSPEEDSNTSLSLFMRLKSESMLTMHTRNYDIENIWIKFDQWAFENDGIPNLIYFVVSDEP